MIYLPIQSLGESPISIRGGGVTKKAHQKAPKKLKRPSKYAFIEFLFIANQFQI